MVDSLCRQLHDVYAQYNDVIHAHKTSKDTSAFQSAKKPLDTAIKDMIAELGRLKNDVAGDPEAHEKVN